MNLNNDEKCIFEREPLEKLTEENQLVSFDHKGFWQCMDTIRDCDQLNEKWNKKMLNGKFAK